MFKKTTFLLLLYPIIIGVTQNWNEDFLTPNTYKNWGDIVFPYDVSSYWNQKYYSWNEHNSSGIGSENTWHQHTLIAGFYYALEKMGVPLWCINRIQIILPIVVLGWSVFYLLASVVKGRHVWIASFISISFVLFAPTVNEDPVPALSLAFFPFILGALIRILDRPKELSFYYLVIPFGVMFTAFSPRNLYLSLITVGFYFIFELINKHEKKDFILNFKSAFISIGLVFLFNFYWLFPVLKFFFSKGDPTLWFDNDLTYSSRLNQYGSFGEISNPLWTFRLLLDRYGVSESPYGFVLFFTPVYAYLSILFIGKNKKLIFFIFISLFFQVLTFGPYFELTRKWHTFLSEHIFGFWIINSPLYPLFFLIILNSVLFGITTTYLLNRFYNSQLIKNSWKPFLKWACVFVLFSYIFIFNGHNFLKTDPPQNKDIRAWGYPKPKKFLNIPSSYFELATYLKENSNSYDKLLNLPWVTLGYANYTWWQSGNPPVPAVIEKLSPIPTTGVGGHPNQILRERWAYSFDNYIFHNFINRNYMRSLLDTIEMGFRYILDHKDYIGVPLAFAPAQGVYRTPIEISGLYKKALETEHFILWETTENKPRVVNVVLENEIMNRKVFNVLASQTWRKKDKLLSPIPKITSFLKINPAKYLLTVSGIYSPVFIITKIPFHPSWEVKISQNNINSQQSDFSFWKNYFPDFADKHFLNLENIGDAQKTFNQFYFSPPQKNVSKSGSYRITIEFKKQRLQNIAFLVSAFSIFLITMFFVIRTMRGKLLLK